MASEIVRNNTMRKFFVCIRIWSLDAYVSFRFCDIKSHDKVDVLEEIKFSDNSIALQAFKHTYAWEIINYLKRIDDKQPKSNSTLSGEMFNNTESIHDQQQASNSSFDATY